MKKEQVILAEREIEEWTHGGWSSHRGSYDARSSRIRRARGSHVSERSRSEWQVIRSQIINTA